MSTRLPFDCGPLGPLASPRDLASGGTYSRSRYLQESTQRFVPGTRQITWDGRVFKYGKCGATLESMKYFVFNYNQLVAEKTTPTATVDAAVAGDTVLGLTVTGATIGVSRNGIIAENELCGGHISIYTSSSDRPQRMIVGNTALAAAGTSFKIEIDEPITATITALTATEIGANPYSDLRRDAGGYASAMGLPCVVAVTDNFFWIQTWGMCRVSPDNNANHGHENNRRQFCVDQYGVSQMPAAYDAAKASRQNVGFVVERSGSAFGDTAPFVMLQISI